MSAETWWFFCESQKVVRAGCDVPAPQQEYLEYFVVQANHPCFEPLPSLSSKGKNASIWARHYEGMQMKFRKRLPALLQQGHHDISEEEFDMQLFKSKVTEAWAEIRNESHHGGPTSNEIFLRFKVSNENGLRLRDIIVALSEQPVPSSVELAKTMKTTEDDPRVQLPLVLQSSTFICANNQEKDYLEKHGSWRSTRVRKIEYARMGGGRPMHSLYAPDMFKTLAIRRTFAGVATGRVVKKRKQ